MIYPGTGVGSGFQIGQPGGPEDPNRKNLQKYLMNKLQGAPGTAGSYASISGQAPGSSVSGNPFLAMLAGRPGENFQNLGIDSNAGGQSLADAGSADISGIGAQIPGHYNSPSLGLGRDGQTASGQNPSAGNPGGTMQVSGVGPGGPNGNPFTVAPQGNASGVNASGVDHFTSPGGGLSAQVNPSLGMSIAGLDPSIQSALMYHIGLIHGSSGGAQTAQAS